MKKRDTRMCPRCKTIQPNVYWFDVDTFVCKKCADRHVKEMISNFNRG